MNAYYWIKLLHIISATILFGTGLGTAFFMLRAHLSNNHEAMRVTVRTVVLADWLFTAPAVVIQIITGVWLTHRLGISFDSLWFVMVMTLYLIVGACWIPVVWIQIQIRRTLYDGNRNSDYKNLMKYWVALGIPAFASVLVLFYLMVFKTGVGTILFN